MENKCEKLANETSYQYYNNLRVRHENPHSLEEQIIASHKYVDSLCEFSKAECSYDLIKDLISRAE